MRIGGGSQYPLPKVKYLLSASHDALCFAPTCLSALESPTLTKHTPTQLALRTQVLASAAVPPDFTIPLKLFGDSILPIFPNCIVTK